MSNIKLSRNQNLRQRQTQSSSSNESDEDLSAGIERLQSRSKPSRGLHQSTSGKVKKKESMHSSSSDDDFDSDMQKASSFSHFYKSTRSGKSEIPIDMGATSIMEIDTQHDRDAQAIRERTLKAQRYGKSADDNAASYPFYKGHSHSADAFKNRYGPQRAPQNIRSTTRWDYAPDICKDYKETGNCGFGDSCKFLHDRSDFKFGWQLDAEYEGGQFGDEECDFEIETCEPEKEEFPDTCSVCREPFRDPVEAKCGHYFCEYCFKASVSKNKKCPICAADVNGYAKVAKDLIQSMKSKRPTEIAVN